MTEQEITEWGNNMGLKSFYESLKEQEVPTVHVNWKPPCQGKKEILDILKKLK